MITQNKRLISILSIAALVLLAPFVAMQFTEAVDWSAADFAIAGLLLFSTGFLCELVMRKVTNWNYRIGFIAVILFALFVIWAELAVGIFGTPFAGS
ncbi:hypothetical protein [Pontibacter oryzae]|uniref:Potassium transporter KefB n=1 Tax=Pontibacter oryzae TaxID=2304593 RepID=A0A399RXD8_9BACT|nr:hypothetical protein [Pontibacter oryzae]RIJ34447.1 hypothetical protein D1627_16170 [Pontibacter oryzae]